MSNRVILVCHAPTSATRQVDFPLDESLDAHGLGQAREQATSLTQVDVVWSSPARRCVETADALGLQAQTERTLRDCDYGRWQGRSLTDIAAGEPDAVAAWLGDPAAAPHGGESVLDLIARAGDWLENLRGGPRRVSPSPTPQWSGPRSCTRSAPRRSRSGGSTSHR